MPQINKKDFSTTGDGDDIFVLTQPGTSFKNLGNLATSGDLASPIRVSATNATVTNIGNLSTSGDGSPGVVIGEPFGTHYDHVTVVNYGSITTTGEVFDDGISFSVAGGIEFFAGDHQSGVNYGTINAIEGIGLAGSHSTLLNYGTIDALGAGFYIEGIEGTLTGVTAINYGQIRTSGPFGGDYGIALFADDSMVKNYGTIQVDGVFDFGIALVGVGDHGENFGTVLATGELGRGVIFEGEDHSFVNKGAIETTGDGSVGVRFSGENLSGTDGGTITNYGSIESASWAVRGSESDDHVVNYGILAGTVDLGGGDDSYLAGHGGSLSGELILGDGNDLVVCQRGCGALSIADFVTGAGSDDVFDLSAFGYHSLDDILAHALQDGGNVLLNLSGHDQLTLLDTSLGSLAADDFLFGSANIFGAAESHGADVAAAALHLDAAPLA